MARTRGGHAPADPTGGAQGRGTRAGRREQGARPPACEGKFTARERLDLLLDSGTFEEIGRFRGGDINKGVAGSAVITGFGEVWGRKVAVYAQDFSVRGGSWALRKAARSAI